MAWKERPRPYGSEAVPIPTDNSATGSMEARGRRDRSWAPYAGLSRGVSIDPKQFNCAKPVIAAGLRVNGSGDNVRPIARMPPDPLRRRLH